VFALLDAISPRYRVAVALCVGLGLREGEAFGLTVPRVDFLRREVQVLSQAQRGQLAADLKTEPSTLIAANLNPKVIQARLGHATITETMDTYISSLPRRRRPRSRDHRCDLRGGSDGTGTEPGNLVTIPPQVSDV